MRNSLHLGLGDIITTSFCAPSTVIGIDHYTLLAFDGSQRTWESLTMISDSSFPFDRWWLVDVPSLGPYTYIRCEAVGPEAAFLGGQSGLVTIRSDGDASLSDETGALAVYEDPKGFLYAEEVFPVSPRLTFRGCPCVEFVA